MSLRSDAVYRIDLRTPSQEDERAGSPPKVVQIRLTEQAFQQLANACSSSPGGSSAGIRIDVDPADPVLVIGDTHFALHAPLLASSGPAGKSHAPSEAGSSSTAPHELYRLSADESTLHRIGTISTKLSVKPTRDVSAVAQRLKQQKEEEEHRKEERRKALMQGATPQQIASSSSRSGINKTLTNARGLSSSPSLVTSSLGRSSSLNRLSTRREPELLPSSLSRGLSREPSPGSRSSSSTALRAKSQLAPHDDSGGVRRADRAYTDSPKVSTTTPSPSSRRLLDRDRHTTESGSSRIDPKRFNLDRTDEDDQKEPEPKPPLSSPVSGTFDVAKKTSKLTTRQRLAKATRAGSRLLAASERRATPERRTAPIISQASPPSKLAAPLPHAVAGSAKAESSSNSLSNVPPRANQKDRAASTAPEQSTKSTRSAEHASVGLERVRKLSPLSATPGTARDKSSTAQEGEAKSRSTQTRAAADRVTAERRAGQQASSAVKADPDSAGIAKRRDMAVTNDHTIPRISKSAVEHDERKPRTAEKEARSAPVQAVNLKTNPNAVGSLSTDSHPSSQSTRKSDARSSDRDGSRRGDPHKRMDSFSDRDARSTTSIASAKHASTRPPEDDRLDSVQRKRRRTNDFDASDSTRDHGRRFSTSPGPSTPRTDDSFVRRRESSRDKSIRRSEPRSPRSDRESRGIPVSASMPSFASASTRLKPVSETSDHDARRFRKEDYHDRRRDPSYDELHDEYATQDRERSSHRDKDDERRGRPSGDAVQTSSRGLPPTTDSAEAERPMRGVGPGATHWSEPWLDVRSKADWHRLAQRFRKTQDEYLLSRKRLEAENERLQWELELASVQDQSESQPAVPAEQSLLFSPHNVPTTSEGGHDTGEVEMATAINTAINSRTRSRPAGEDGDESPEEGEMRSSDDEDGHVTAKMDRISAPPVRESVQVSRRSESPENFAWRSGGVKTQGVERPLSYADLVERVKQLEEMHGSLSRMHRVLVEFKAKSVAATG